MSYFKKTILPPSDKRNVVGYSGSAGIMLADDYNIHNAELQAIEQFLGTGNPTDDQAEAVSSLSTSSQNVLGVPAYLCKAFNRLVGGTICCSSGSIHSGRRISFPYNAQATFLTQPLGTSSKTISVTMTDGFPDKGVVSILNDTSAATAASAVEWISYNGKEDTRLLNCQRGNFGTAPGNHGVPSGATGLNVDVCLPLSVNATPCDSRYAAWRSRDNYAFVEFDLEGDLISIKKAIRLHPTEYSLSDSSLGANRDAILQAADEAGILAASPFGEPILRSADPVFAAACELSWSEASDFVDALVTAEVVKLLTSGAQWEVGNAPFIPVFCGRMGVAYSLAAVTLSPASASSRTFLQVPIISQSADGMVSMANSVSMIQQVVQYKTFFVGNPEGE